MEVETVEKQYSRQCNIYQDHVSHPKDVIDLVSQSL